MKLWRALEEVAGLNAVPAVWARALGDEFAVVRDGFLRSNGRKAETWWCEECLCSHRVVPKGAAFVGVCECEPQQCDDVVLSAADLGVLELSWNRLGRAIAKALGCDVKETDLGLPGTMQVASLAGAALPIVLTIQEERETFRSVVGQLAARFQKPFILLAPTSRFVDGIAQGFLANVKAGFFDLESQLTLLPSGILQARQTGGEMFSKYLPEAKEPASDDEARGLFALVKQLESEKRWRKAPVLQVFRLYCIEGLSRRKVADECGCVDSLVTLRLKAIEHKLHRKPVELRALSGHFQKIEESLSDPRAKKIRRRSAMDDDRFGDEGRD